MNHGPQGEQGGADVNRAGLAALIICGLFITIGLFSPGLVLPQIERSFAATPHAPLLTELVGTLASFAFAIGSPFAGMLVARFGCRRVILPSLVAFAITGAAPALLNDLWPILVARVGIGLSLSGIFTGALGGIGALKPDVRARMFGWFSVAGGSSAIILFPLIGALGHLGWRPAFVVNLASLIAVPFVLLLPATLGRVQRSAHGDSVRAAEGSLLNPAMVGLLLLAALTGMGMLVGAIYAPLYLSSTGITDTRLLAIPVTIGSIASVITSASYGAVHRRLGMMGICVLVLLVMGGAMIFAGLTTDFVPFTVAIVLFSGMIALMSPNVNACALAVSPPSKAAQAIGLANGVMFGSQLIFPFVASWVRGMAGLSGVFITFGCTMAVAGLLAAMASRARRTPRSALA